MKFAQLIADSNGKPTYGLDVAGGIWWLEHTITATGDTVLVAHDCPVVDAVDHPERPIGVSPPRNAP